MSAFKVKSFERFAQKHEISDVDLLKAAHGVIAGNFDADLGGGVYKQRVARTGQGRSSGFRTLLAHRTSEHIFFVFGFAKNEKDNVTQKELKALKAQARTLGELSTNQIASASQCGALIEVEHGGDQDQEQENTHWRKAGTQVCPKGAAPNCSRRQEWHPRRSP